MPFSKRVYAPEDEEKLLSALDEIVKASGTRRDELVDLDIIAESLMDALDSGDPAVFDSVVALIKAQAAHGPI